MTTVGDPPSKPRGVAPTSSTSAEPTRSVPEMREYDFTGVSRTLGPMFRLHRPARHEGGLVHQIVVIIGISVLSGALIAGLALPWVGLVSKGAENSADAVKN